MLRICLGFELAIDTNVLIGLALDDATHGTPSRGPNSALEMGQLIGVAWRCELDLAGCEGRFRSSLIRAALFVDDSRAETGHAIGTGFPEDSRSGSRMMSIDKFVVDVPQRTLDDLHDRLERTRWADEIKD